MPLSIWSTELDTILSQARSLRTKSVEVGNRSVEIPSPFPSPVDWRDVWIYQIMVDRFNNPMTQPRHSWNGEHNSFQGGTLDGVRQQLEYLQELGVGALWLSPVLKNCQYQPSTYHGYGIQDFLTIDPRFASNPTAAANNPQLVETELQSLIDEAHGRGMYVIFDIVLNHTGDVFEYDGHGAAAPWRNDPYTIHWRDEQGHGRSDWTQPPAAPPPDAVVWPVELQHNRFFRRQGKGGEAGGDFETLKEMVTGIREFSQVRGVHHPVRDVLIRAHQHLIARYDIDGFRIDTLKYIEPEFAQIFANSIREFALSIGKKNFFTFGEVYDNEEKIAHFIGRHAMEAGDLIGVDAALDFPVFYKLPWATKGLVPPIEVANLFEHRKQVQRGIISTHGEASKFFVTFLDNHDQHQRFYYQDPNNPHRFDDQVGVSIGCLFTLQGIPCLYYGTEQGLHGAGGTLEAVREALWGMPKAFDRNHAFYRLVQQLTSLRQSQPALRYGRQYFRPLSGDSIHFGISPFPSGVLAFSRILQDQEIVIVANTNTQSSWAGEVIVDFSINPVSSNYQVIFSNKAGNQVVSPGSVIEKAASSVEVREVDGSVNHGPLRALPVTLQPMEIQVMHRTN